MTNIQKTRVELLKGMNTYMLQLGNETLLGAWFLTGIPDCPDEEDFEFFATDDDEWNYIVRLFGRLTIERGL
jgi:hypothetical protein